ncbi:hypothetical protein M231_02630 [Tremella mesenterica]|uniref:Uncharacterized protein n=1 Tax=Tremella mesenterica TaxID=5217 RepID=A0A4Q1BQS0_TREME|nr:uncharacterized protein TREMEDRAFT_61228 [Tremella mesenterica DSM 1558]EIW70716.1 hypothetical protein TREMEDRAFT_61228 [Tremella mesenterica DSM 1558]RXK40172.1 hypothetical protein M231_02630 [Tremella mesenterica]
MLRYGAGTRYPSRRLLSLRQTLRVIPQRRSWSDDPTFRPPPISSRIRPIIPFLIYWTFVTSLALNLLKIRKRAEEDNDRYQARISVLQGVIRGLEEGRVDEEEMRRDLEMVGLRDRRGKEVVGDLGIVRPLSWREALFGLSKGKDTSVHEGDAETSLQEWLEAVGSSPSTTSHPSPPLFEGRAGPDNSGGTRRAPSSRVYL